MAQGENFGVVLSQDGMVGVRTCGISRLVDAVDSAPRLLPGPPHGGRLQCVLHAGRGRQGQDGREGPDVATAVMFVDCCGCCRSRAWEVVLRPNGEVGQVRAFQHSTAQRSTAEHSSNTVAMQ